jgi:prepilin-type N-terminal cleavage/methylation domain-containing protein
MKTTRQRRNGIAGRRRSGFTIVEILVAIVVLVVGVLGLASSSAVVSRLIGGGAQQALAANVAQSRFEILRSRPCATIVNGSASARGVTEQWRVQQVATRMYDVEVLVTYSTPGGPRQPVAYRSHVPCRP